MVQSITKPQQPRGISNIPIPGQIDNQNQQWESIYDPPEIKARVLQQHQQHFSQVKGAVFMQEPLSICYQMMRVILRMVNLLQHLHLWLKRLFPLLFWWSTGLGT